MCVLLFRFKGLGFHESFCLINTNRPNFNTGESTDLRCRAFKQSGFIDQRPTLISNLKLQNLKHPYETL